jgi:hypothetical protein
VRDLAAGGSAIVSTTSSGVHVSRARGASWAELLGTDDLDAHAAILDPADGSLVIGGRGFGLTRVALP